jgi:periplasmic protein TonB
MKTSLAFPILAVVLILSSSTLFAQATSKESVDSTNNVPEDDVFVPVEVDPSFDMQELQSRLKYPEEARKNGVEGKVTIQCYISKEGKILKTRIVQSDNPLLEEAAVNAIKQITFTPAIQDGKPIGLWMTIPITFTLN